MPCFWRNAKMRKMWNCPKKRCDIAIAYVGVKVKGAYMYIYDVNEWYHGKRAWQQCVLA